MGEQVIDGMIGGRAAEPDESAHVVGNSKPAPLDAAGGNIQPSAESQELPAGPNLDSGGNIAPGEVQETQYTVSQTTVIHVEGAGGDRQNTVKGTGGGKQYDSDNTLKQDFDLPHWDDLQAPWDRLRLGDNVLPGVWEIESGERACKLDHKKTKGKNSAKIKDQGDEPAKLTAKGRMIDKLDWFEMQRVLEYIQPRSKAHPRAPLSIAHPAAAFIGITTVYVQRIQVPRLNNGVLEVTIDLVEWRQPIEAKTTNVRKVAGEKFAAWLKKYGDKPLADWDDAMAREYYELATAAAGGVATEQITGVLDAAARERKKQQAKQKAFQDAADHAGMVYDPQEQRDPNVRARGLNETGVWKSSLSDHDRSIINSTPSGGNSHTLGPTPAWGGSGFGGFG